jgi:U3 small nucleolar RNA-associated protein 22
MGKRNRSSSCTDRGEESKKKRKKQKNSKLGRERKSSLHLPEEKRDDKNQGFESVEEQFSHESERLASLGKPQKNSKSKDDDRVPELGAKVAETGKIDDMCDDDDSDNGDDYADGDGDDDDGGGGGISDDDNVCDDDCCDSGDIGEDNFGVDGDIDAGGSVDRETSEFSDKSPSKGKQKNTSGLYRPLTREEMQSLKETENLYKSNLLRLQIKELLSEVSPSEHPKVPEGLEEYLKHLKVFLESLPASDPLSIADAMSSLPKGVKYPLSFSGSYPKVTFSFKPPSSVKVVGSWLVKTYLRKNYDVNLALEMPQSSFQEKDYLGHRYFHKRALYLCRLAGHLKASGLCKKVVFTDFRGDRLTPVLSLVPVDERIKHCTIRLHPHLGKPLTKLIRLAPDRNCVREFTVKKHTLEAERDGDNVLNPTPHYNNALIADTTGLLGTHLEEIFTTAQDCTAFRDAVVLLKVWLHQRKLDQGFGCIGGFLVSMLLVYLVRKKKVTRTMSSYQILRVFWSFVSTSAWDEEGISLAQEDSTGPSMDVFNTSFDVVFVDSSGWYNLCSDVDVSKYHRFKHESELALSLLDSTSVDGFEKLFMTSVVFAENFDVLLHVDLSSAAKMYATNAEKCSDHVTSVLDFGDNLRQKLLRDVAVVLSKGLGRRVRLLSFEPKETAEWQVSKKQPSPDSHVTLGLLLDTDHAFGVIEMGPPADSAEVGCRSIQCYAEIY